MCALHLPRGLAVLLDLAGTVPTNLGLPPRVDLVRATCTDDLGAAALLVRPDGYICWATDGSAAHDDTLLAAIADNLAKAH